jgi:threonine dehydrogenase-like Zn-dependent dehydrogenase
MKAAVFRGAGKPLSIETVEDPTPGPGDVIIRTHRCGICGTDLHMTSGHGWDFAEGSVIGHEYAGEIVELGRDVEGLKKGQLITGLPSAGCGKCEACAHGNFGICSAMTGVLGGFGEYTRIPSHVAVTAPAGFTAADTALIEPFAVGLYGVRMAAIRPGDRVLVLGAGTVALTTLFWARRLGAGRVVALSRAARRAEMARKLGADAFVQAGESEIAEVVEALGGPPDIVFECAGAPGLLGQATAHVRAFGQVVSMGFCTSPDPLVPAVASFKGVCFAFPAGYALRDFEHAANVLGAGDFDPKVLITSVVPLDELPAAFEALRGPNTETKVHVSLL